jgi:hypothetical protein
MNPMTPFPGGGILSNLTPIWYPPIAVKWIVTGLVVFAGASAGRMGLRIRSVFNHPAGFFLTALLAILVFQYGFPPAAFAILFFLLSIWSENSLRAEGFLDATNTVDWVQNSKRWYVETVMRERPVAIQEKEISTYPVQGSSTDSSQALSS